MTKSCECTIAHIKGMHCHSCEVLLERQLKKIPGVTKVQVKHSTGTAKIEHTQEISLTQIKDAVTAKGYALIDKDTKNDHKLAPRDYVELGVTIIVLLGAYLLLKQFDVLPSAGLPESLGIGAVFVIGLIAAVSSCLAVTGGLLLALSAKYSEQHPDMSGTKKFKPVLYFNFGRLVGYFVLGALLGALGGLFALSPFASGIIALIAALVMILLGLQMLHIIPWLNKMRVSMPKFIAHRIHDQSSGEYKAWAPIVLGAGTFFLPCGFTQALQLFVLTQGNWLSGGIIMLVFALGTLPTLLAVGAASSFIKGSAQKHFIRIAALLVIVLGIFSLKAAITLVSLGF